MNGRPGRGGRGGEGDAQHFNEVKDDRERVDGHRQPAHYEACVACVRAPVEAAHPQYSAVVLVQVVPGVLCRREPAEDCGWVCLGSEKREENRGGEGSGGARELTEGGHEHDERYAVEDLVVSPQHPHTRPHNGGGEYGLVGGRCQSCILLSNGKN